MNGKLTNKINDGLTNQQRWKLRHPDYMKEYRRVHKEEHKMYVRNHYVHTNGKAIRIKKRPWTGICELCNLKAPKLSWHHWDDEHPEFGIWLCRCCHIAVEFYEMGRIRKYIEFKEKIEKQTRAEW